MRSRTIYDGKGNIIREIVDGVVTYENPSHQDDKVPAGYYVMPDIQPYKSMIDGSIIGSRSQHRAHLRQNGCIEIGNETKYLKSRPVQPPPGLKETIIRVAEEKLRN